MKLRIWHMPQIGVEDCTFKVDVKTVDEAALLLNTLWDYDLFQYKKKIKPDYSNASGLEYWNKYAKGWQEYYNEEGNDICKIIDERRNSKKMTKRFDEYYYTVSAYGNIKVDKGKVPTRKQIKIHVKENISKYLNHARIENIENRKNQTSYLEIKEDK